MYFCSPFSRRRVRVVEGARLESVYTPKGYHEFESHRLRQSKTKCRPQSGIFLFQASSSLLESCA